MPSCPPRHNQRLERQKEPKSCTRAAGKDRVHQHFPMTLGSVHVPRTKPTASETTPAKNAQSTGESTLNIPPHGAPSCWICTVHSQGLRASHVLRVLAVSIIHWLPTTFFTVAPISHAGACLASRVSQLASCGTLSTTFQTLPTTWRGQSVAFPRNTGFSLPSVLVGRLLADDFRHQFLPWNRRLHRRGAERKPGLKSAMFGSSLAQVWPPSENLETPSMLHVHITDSRHVHRTAALSVLKVQTVATTDTRDGPFHAGTLLH